MSDVRRIADPGSDASQAARDLVASARADGPPDGARVRAKARLERALAADGGALSEAVASPALAAPDVAPVAQAPIAARRRSRGLAVGMTLAAIIVAASVVGTVFVVRGPRRDVAAIPTAAAPPSSAGAVTTGSPSVAAAPGGNAPATNATSAAAGSAATEPQGGAAHPSGGAAAAAPAAAHAHTGGGGTVAMAGTGVHTGSAAPGASAAGVPTHPSGGGGGGGGGGSPAGGAAAPASSASGSGCASRCHGDINCLLNCGSSGSGGAGGGSSVPSTPSRQDVITALDGVRATVQRCANGNVGTVPVTLTFGATGDVESVSVGGTFAGTPAGRCIADAVRGVHVPAFSRPSFTVTYPFALR
jgi:hypothetical protein